MGCKQCKILFTKQDRTIHAPSTITNYQEQSFSMSSLQSQEWPLLTFDNLPVELIYHILDRLDIETIFTSLYNVCRRLNSILRTYDRYKLDFQSISLPYFHQISSFIRPEQIVSLTLSDGNETVGLVEMFLKKFPMDSFQRLQSLTLLNIDDSEQMIHICLSLTDQLRILSIENPTEIYEDTVIDILMTIIAKKSLHQLSLDIERDRILNPSIIWPSECFLQDIKLAGRCNISLFRQILISTPNLRTFQADDIDFDDEWIDENDEHETDPGSMLAIVNASNITSLALIYARNEMEKIEWFIPQFIRLKYLKYLNIYDFHIEPFYDSDYSLLDGERWETILGHCLRFEFIFTMHSEEEDSWNIHHCLATFQTKFWKEKNWNIVLEQYEKLLLIYSLPYAHSSHYYDRPIFFSLPHNAFLLSQSMANVTKLRVNLSAVNDIIGPPRFPHVSQLILDGSWRNMELADSIGSLVCLANVKKLIRLERVPTAIFGTFISRLENLKSLTLTTFVLDGLNAAVFQYIQCLYSFHIVQFDDNYRHFVNVEPFCTMFPQIEHLDIPIDNLDSCQYVIDRLENSLISVVFRFPSNEDEDEDEDDDDDDEDENHGKYRDLIEWARTIQHNHQYRIRDGDIYLWLEQTHYC